MAANSESSLRALIGDSEMVLPDYAGHGLFNLAVSLARLAGGEVSSAASELLLPDGVAASKRWAKGGTVFILIDGLGDDYLCANREIAPALLRDRISSLTSVFPSTTATAITTLMSAQPASVHGQLGWFVRDERTGQIVASLPMRYRGGEYVRDLAQIGRLLPSPWAFRNARRSLVQVTLPDIAYGPYNRAYAAAESTLLYRTLEQLPAVVANASVFAGEDALVYVYIPMLDATAHEAGIASERSRQTLADIDQAYAKMREMLPEARFVVTADHGFVDSPEARRIDLRQIPILYDMLRAPLSGERRVAYCHVKPSSVNKFGPVCREYLGHAVLPVKSDEAWSAGLFGPSKSETVRDRCGDWILIAREDWTVLDWLPGEKPFEMIGVHGGMTHQEMRVPLIVAE